MKNKFALGTLAGFILAVVLAIQFGCATPQVTPGSPAQPAITNAATGAVTPAVAATPPMTNYVPNTTVGQIVTTGTAVAPLIPAPWGTLLYLALGVLGAGATAVAQIKSSQLNTTQGQLATAQAIHNTIIQGVQAAGAAAAAVKQSIAATALANGNADAVEAAVNKVTGSA